ncbi:hypothetical protein WKV44_01480 [Spirochaetia bacterium 38H-sp]|uniref:Uncharacterized protein n=1 Tax=Rarispira pelagica TaxID=3141764 RepID=A0ABU9U9P5_9SPIR
MRRLGSSFIKTSLVVYVVSLALSTVWALFFEPAKDVVPALWSSWAWKTVFIIWIENFMFFHFTAMTITISFILPPLILMAGETKAKMRFIQLILVFTIFMSAVFFFFNEGVLPSLVSSREDILYRSRLASQFFNQYEKAIKANDVINAYEALNRYANLIPENEDTKKLLKNLAMRLPEDRRKKEQPDSFIKIEHNLSIGKAISLSEEAINREDYYTAYYYARIALGLDSSHQTARWLASRAWDAILSLEENSEDRAQRVFFASKREAYQKLIDGKYLAAYYHFLRLSKENPKDADVIRYLAEAKKAVETYAFYYDEIEELVETQGINNVLFSYAQDNISTFYFIKRIVRVREGSYCFDIRMMATDKKGKVLYRLSAPYGKIEENSLVMQAVGRDNPNIRYTPKIWGTVPFKPEFIVPLPMEDSQLHLFSITEQGFQGKSLSELMSLSFLPAEFGVPKKEVVFSMFSRIFRVLIFLTGSFIVITLAWRGHNRSMRNSIAALIPAIPVIGGMMWLLSNILLRGGDFLVAGILVTVGFAGVVWFMVLFCVFMLFVSIFLFARSLQ